MWQEDRGQYNSICYDKTFSMLPPGHKHTLPLVVKAIDIDCKQFLFLLTLRGANVAGFYRCCWNENSLGVYYFHLMHGVVGDFLWKMAVTSLTFN